MTGVLRDGVPSEITSLSKTVWLVAEALLSAALLLVDDDLTLVTGRLGHEDGLTVAAFEVTAHGCTRFVGTTGDLEFVAREGFVTFADKEAVNHIAELSTRFETQLLRPIL